MLKIIAAALLIAIAAPTHAGDVATLLSKHGFPSILAEQSFYQECSNLQSEPPKITSFKVCSKEQVPNCPHTSGSRCDISADFINGKTRKVDVSYAYGSFGGDKLKAELDQMYGNAIIDQKSTPFGKSWSAAWSSGSAKIRILRMEGENIHGQRYNNVTLMFIDNSLPDPFQKAAPAAPAGAEEQPVPEKARVFSPSELEPKITKYAEAIGCGAGLGEKNIAHVSFPILKYSSTYVAMVDTDIACSGGTGTDASRLVFLASGTSREEEAYVVPALSEPSAVVTGGPRYITSLYTKNGQLHATGLEYGPNDANCCPSIRTIYQVDLTHKEILHDKARLPSFSYHWNFVKTGTY